MYLWIELKTISTNYYSEISCDRYHLSGCNVSSGTTGGAPRQRLCTLVQSVTWIFIEAVRKNQLTFLYLSAGLRILSPLPVYLEISFCIGWVNHVEGWRFLFFIFNIPLVGSVRSNVRRQGDGLRTHVCLFVFAYLCACFLLDVKMSKNSKVLNLKDKINDNEMDLSLCNLSEVPVRELVSSH